MSGAGACRAGVGIGRVAEGGETPRGGVRQSFCASVGLRGAAPEWFVLRTRNARPLGEGVDVVGVEEVKMVVEVAEEGVVTGDAVREVLSEKVAANAVVKEMGSSPL